MSVGTLVTYRRAEPKTDYLPLATEEEFYRFWLPLAQELHLQWVPLFADGVPLAACDVPPVLEELARILEAIATGASDPETKARMLERARLLIVLLESLDLDDVEEVYIG